MVHDSAYQNDATTFKHKLTQIIVAINNSPTRSLPPAITPQTIVNAIEDPSKLARLANQIVEYRRHKHLREDEQSRRHHYTHIRPYRRGQSVLVRLSKLTRPNMQSKMKAKAGDKMWSKDLYTVEDVIPTTPLPSYSLIHLMSGRRMQGTFSHGDLKVM